MKDGTRSKKPQKGSKLSGNVLILTYWPVRDALIQTYTLPYVKLIRDALNIRSQIYLQTLERDNFPKDDKTRVEQHLLTYGAQWVTCRYTTYGIKLYFYQFMNFITLLNLCLSKKIAVIHVWCTPPGIIGYLLHKITGAKLVLDSYEPHAEAMVENLTWQKRSLKYTVLSSFERLITRRASFIIACTRSMKNYVEGRYKEQLGEFFVKPACVDTNKFNLKERKNKSLLKDHELQDKIILVYAGKFGGIYFDVEVFEIAKVASTVFGPKFRFLILSSQSSTEIHRYCSAANLPLEVIIHKFVNHHDVPKYMGLADFAITPVKPTPSKRHCTPIKDGEYWALGLPIIITNEISDDSSIVEAEDIGYVLKSNTHEEYLRAVLKIQTLLKQEKRALASRIRNVALTYRNFSIARSVYNQIYC